MFKIFITKSIYDSIIGSNDNTLLYRMLQWQKGEHVKTLSDAATKEYEINPQKVYENPSSLYVLGVTKKKAEEIRENYGVMCVSGDDPDVSLLLDINDTFEAKPNIRRFDGWDKVLDSVETLPSNAILLADRYLFSYESILNDRDLNNVYRILNELLPVKFNGAEYHVTVAFCMSAIYNKLTFEEIDNRLNDVVERLKTEDGNRPARNYNIMLEVLGYTRQCCIYHETHHRRIVSNYYYVQVEQQLTAFKSDLTGVIKQNIIPWALFTDSGLAGNSSLPLETIDDATAIFKKFNQKYANKSLSDPSLYYEYSVNGTPMKTCPGLKNRLFK